jgi:signal transduction histidine kinase
MNAVLDRHPAPAVDSFPSPQNKSEEGMESPRMASAFYTSVEHTALRSLISHRESTAADTSLAEVYREFQVHGREYVAVLARDGAIGVCSRGEIGFLLGSRYGFAINGKRRAADSMLKNHLEVRLNTPVRTVLDLALQRQGTAFYDDVMLLDEDGAYVGMISVQTLVNLQSKMIAEQFAFMRQQERKLAREEKQALLETLVGGIAHEINNKLAPIAGFSDLMLMKSLPTNLRSYCVAIKESAMESSKIIRQLLQLSKPSRGELAPTKLADLVRDMLTVMEISIRNAGVTLDLKPYAEDAVLLVDASQIKQVLMNLIINALDAMQGRPKKELSIEVTVLEKTARIRVSDTGHGISPKHLQRIFDPFFTTKGPDKGTGLGLSVSLSIIKQHGGEIDVSSQVDQGATFAIKLPLASANLPSPHTELASPREENPAAKTVSKHERLSFLVVDDEDYILNVVREILMAHLRCSVISETRAMSAMERIRNEEFDAIISDVRMPEYNGVQFFRWVQREKPALASRFFFITGDMETSLFSQKSVGLGMVHRFRG